MDSKLVHCSTVDGEMEDDDDDDGDEDGDGEGSCVAAEAPVEEAICREKTHSGSWKNAMGATVVRRGWAIGKRLALVGAAVGSAPVVVPPLLLFSTVGLALSVPFGLYFAGFICTEKLMSSLLPLPKEEELLKVWEEDAVEAIAREEEEEIVNGGLEETMTVGKSDREEEVSDGEREGHGDEDVAIVHPATTEARENAGEELIGGRPIGEDQVVEEEGEDSNAVPDGQELRPIVVSIFTSEALEGSGEKMRNHEDSTLLDVPNGVDAREKVSCSGDNGQQQERQASELDIVLNLVADDEIENNFVDSASEVDALVLDPEEAVETMEDYDLIEGLPMAGGWQEEEVAIGVLEENALVLDTNDIAYTSDGLIEEELSAAETGREEEFIDMGVNESVLDVPMFDNTEAQEEEVGIVMIDNSVTGVLDDDALALGAEAAAETAEQIILMGELQLEDEWPKEEASELALGCNAAAVEIEVSGSPVEVADDLKSEWLQVPEGPTTAEVVMDNDGGIDEGVNEPEREIADEEVEAETIEVSCRSPDAETNGFVEQLQGTQLDVIEPTSSDVLFPVEVEIKTRTSHLNSEGGTTNDQTHNLNAKDEAEDYERPNAVDHGADRGNEEVAETEAELGSIATAPEVKAAQEISDVAAVEVPSPPGAADRESSLNTEPSVNIHNYETSLLSDDESRNAEEKLWQQVFALRTIVGYRAPLRSSLAEELKDLYLFTGIDRSSDASVEDSDNRVLQLSAQLQFLKLVIGVE